MDGLHVNIGSCCMEVGHANMCARMQLCASNFENLDSLFRQRAVFLRDYPDFTELHKTFGYFLLDAIFLVTCKITQGLLPETLII